MMPGGVGRLLVSLLCLVFPKVHLLTRPDRADPAVCFLGFRGRVFRAILEQGWRRKASVRKARWNGKIVILIWALVLIGKPVKRVCRD
jgi:hypothetical protein